jgi:predicted AAA+ superfamily ATPase
VVFDEVHQLRDPARVLKVGADFFPHLKILATGSSTLAATRKFSDSLTGRKHLVHLVPVLVEELPAFGDVPLQTRLLHGGLPEALLAPSPDPRFYREWTDSFFARDIQRLFGFRDVNRFTAFFEYLCRRSGGQMDVATTARDLAIARPTVESHLRALEITHAATIVRPFSGGGCQEIVKAPRVYAFDSGFVAWSRGWNPLRQDDLGILWEHVVLEHLLAHLREVPVRYWRDTRGHEVDFVLPRGRGVVDAIECTWDAARFDPAGMLALRKCYPEGRNLLVTPAPRPAHARRFRMLEMEVLGLADLTARVRHADP